MGGWRNCPGWGQVEPDWQAERLVCPLLQGLDLSVSTVAASQIPEGTLVSGAAGAGWILWIFRGPATGILIPPHLKVRETEAQSVDCDLAHDSALFSAGPLGRGRLKGCLRLW